jgi:hypothetical protein
VCPRPLPGVPFTRRVHCLAHPLLGVSGAWTAPISLRRRWEILAPLQEV